MLMPSAQGLDQALDRNARIARLRLLLPALEGAPPADAPALPFHLLEVDHALPARGLAVGALHEIAPAGDSHMAAAFGFAAACLAGAGFKTPSLLVVPNRFVGAYGAPYGHGLHLLGLDPGHLLIFTAGDHKAALWAAEEALRSGGVGSVLALLTGPLDLKTSRRLHLAAASTGTFLTVVRPARAEPAGAAVSRWRIAAAPARRCRFDGFEGTRWRVALERARNGRAGSWLMEWDHGAHRFRVAGALAGEAPPAGPAGPRLLRAG
ncbi:MAG TPA: ImuA protein [Microvirga sp.]|nr:ImuA protein [Microvirga sp.]